MKKQLHIVTQSLLILAILLHVFRPIKLIGSSILERLVDGNAPIAVTVYGCVLSVAMIVSLVLILRLNKYGFYFFLGIQFINAFFASSITGKHELNIISSILIVAYVSSLLLLKRDGINGYQAMGISEIEEKKEEHEEQTETPVENEIIPTENEEISLREVGPTDEKGKHRKDYSKWYPVILGAPILILSISALVGFLNEKHSKPSKVEQTFVNNSISDSDSAEIDECWDEENYEYTNLKYGFTWDLPQYLKWERTTGSKSTIFVAIDTSAIIKVSVKCEKVPLKSINGYQNLWAIRDEKLKNFRDSVCQFGEVNNVKTQILYYKKRIFNGCRAFKGCFLFGSNNSLEDNAEMVQISYFYYRKKYFYTVTLLAEKSLLDWHEDEIQNIFKGYTLINEN